METLRDASPHSFNSGQSAKFFWPLGFPVCGIQTASRSKPTWKAKRNKNRNSACLVLRLFCNWVVWICQKTYFKKMCFFWSGKCLYSPPLIFLDICWLRFVFWVICPTLSCLCRWQWGSKICSGAVAVDSGSHTKVEQKKWVRQFWGRTFRSENVKIKELKVMSAAIIWVVLNVLSCFQTIIWYFQLIVSLWQRFSYLHFLQFLRAFGNLFYVFCKIPGLSML